MPDSTVNIIHELTFQVNEASVQKVDELFANMTRSLQALTNNTKQVSTNLTSLIDTLNKGTTAAKAYSTALKDATTAANKFAAANANVGNLVGAAIGKMNAGVVQAIQQMQNLHNSMLAGLSNSAQRIKALEDEAKAAQAAAAAVQNLQNQYNNLRPPQPPGTPAGGPTPPIPPAGGGGGGGSRSNLGPMGGEGLFGISGDYLMRRFISGYIVGGAFRAVNATIDTITKFVMESGEMASKLDGITKAFQRLGDPSLLAGLREATGGTISDLDLMQKAVNAVNLGLPVQELGKAFQFARIRARETGQDVDYLVNSIVLGIGRKSPLILDNLGINALRVRTRFKELGDFTKAAFEIINEEIAKSGKYVDQYADRSDRLTAALKNQQAALGEATNAVADYSKAFLLDIYEIIFTTGKVVENIENLRKARAAFAKDQEISKEAQSFANRQYGSERFGFQRFEDQLKEADPHQVNLIKQEAKAFADRLKAIDEASGKYTDDQLALRNRVYDSMYQRFERAASQQSGSIAKLTAESLKLAGQSPLTAYFRDELQVIRDKITEQRKFMDITDKAEIKRLADLDKEAKRQQDLIDATEKKTHGERVKASSLLELRQKIAKAEEDIIQAREAREVGSFEKIEKLRQAEVDRANENLNATEDDLRRRLIITNNLNDKRSNDHKKAIAELRALYVELAKLRANNETEALKEKQSVDRQNAYNAAIESARNARVRREAAGRVSTIEAIQKEVEEGQKNALAAEHLYHQQQLRALEGQDKALEYEEIRHQNKIEDIRLDYAARSLDAIGKYYDQVRRQLSQQAAFEMSLALFPFTQEQEEITEHEGGLFYDKSRRRKLLGIRKAVVEAQKLAGTAQTEKDIAFDQLRSSADTSVFGLIRPPQAVVPKTNTAEVINYQKAVIGVVDASQKAADANEKLDKANENYRLALQENIPKIIDLYNTMASSVAAAYQQISQAQQAQMNNEIRIREERLRQAERFADRGNTAFLRQEQERLDRSYRQQAQAATRQIAINTALTASQAALGVVKAAVEGTSGGPFLIAANVIAFLAAIASGIIAANAAAANSMPSVQFWEGGFTGEGDKYAPAGIVHKGEWVSNQETTRRHRRVLEAMHDGTFDDKYIRVDQAQLSISADLYGRRDKQILGKLDGLIEAVEGNKISVKQSMDARGLHQMVEQIKRRERQRFA